jgi:hypothetical protein
MPLITPHFWVLEFELRTSPLSGRHFTSSTIFLLLVNFEVGFLHFCLGPPSDHDPPTYAFLIAGMTGAYDHTWLIDWGGSSHFVWPWTLILHISTSLVAEITGVNHSLVVLIFHSPSGALKTNGVRSCSLNCPPSQYVDIWLTDWLIYLFIYCFGAGGWLPFKV